MTFLEKALAILSLIKAAQEIEKAIPLSGFGKEKADLVIDTLSIVGENTTEMIPLVQKVITLIVNTLKVTGIFK
jgi:hypothetical protein